MRIASIILSLSLVALSSGYAADIVRIESYLTDGNRFLASGAFDQAIDSCKMGIAELGKEYFTGDFIDDSGLKLVLADEAASKANTRVAAGMYCRVLEDRVFAYRHALEKRDGKK